MRLWTLHPQYLDARGLVALWREALLARAVLRGRTRGYRHHPQLARFRATRQPVACLNAYLRVVYDEAVQRGYAFDPAKLGRATACHRIPVTTGQLTYEWAHLKVKLAARDPHRWQILSKVRRPRPHPLFIIRSVRFRAWERRTTLAQPYWSPRPLSVGVGRP